jgi:hypothetical protein
VTNTSKNFCNNAFIFFCLTLTDCRYSNLGHDVDVNEPLTLRSQSDACFLFYLHVQMHLSFATMPP